MRCCLALLLLLTACGPAPAPPSPPATAVVAKPPPAPDPCAGKHGVELIADPFDLACPEGRSYCYAKMPVAILSCASDPVELTHVEIGPPNAGHISFDFDPHPRLARGESKLIGVPTSHDGEYPIAATILAGSGAPLQVTTTARVRNSTYDAAREACRQCHGDWGAHGLAGHEGCNCSTTDAGKTCRDGDECEGLCLYDHTEIIQAPEPTRCRDGSCSARLGLGVYLGKCSSHRMLFGCHAILGPGAAKEPPHVLPGRVSSTCID